MNCSDAREAMLSRLDDPDEILDRHLGACPTCADEWRLLSSAWATREDLRAPRAPVALQQRVLANLEQRHVFERRWLGGRSLMWMARGLAAAVLVCYGVLGLMVAWSLGTRTPSTSHALSPDVARVWARLPDQRNHAWLERELGPDRPLPSTSHAHAVALEPLAWRNCARLERIAGVDRHPASIDYDVARTSLTWRNRARLERIAGVERQPASVGQGVERSHVAWRKGGQWQ